MNITRFSPPESHFPQRALKLRHAPVLPGGLVEAGFPRAALSIPASGLGLGPRIYIFNKCPDIAETTLENHHPRPSMKLIDASTPSFSWEESPLTASRENLWSILSLIYIYPFELDVAFTGLFSYNLFLKWRILKWSLFSDAPYQVGGSTWLSSPLLWIWLILSLFPIPSFFYSSTPLTKLKRAIVIIIKRCDYVLFPLDYNFLEGSNLLTLLWLSFSTMWWAYTPYYLKIQGLSSINIYRIQSPATG